MEHFGIDFVPEPNTGCWFWVRAINHFGYGRVTVGARQTMAHRLSYELLRGPVPDGLCLDHLCRQRSCVNPDHLEAVTMRENLLRGDTLNRRNASRTHCPQGHPYDALNTYHIPTGGRGCKACMRVRSKAHYAKRRLQNTDINIGQ